MRIHAQFVRRPHASVATPVADECGGAGHTTRAQMTTVRTYLFHQFLRAAGSVSLILLIIGAADALFRTAQAAVDPSTSLQLALLYMVNAVIGSILPIGVYFGLFLAIGRMCQTQELYSLYGCGVPRTEIRRVLFILITPILLFSTVVSFFVYPALKLQASQMRTGNTQSHIIATLEHGGILSAGRLTAMRAPPFGAPSVDGGIGSPPPGVDIGALPPREGIGSPPLGVDIDSTETAMVMVYRLDGSYLIQLANSLSPDASAGARPSAFSTAKGEIYFRSDKSDITAKFQYEDSRFDLFGSGGQKRALRAKDKNIIQLWHSANLADRIELQKRILAPLMFLICFVFAVYCAEIMPRQSSYARVPQAMIMLVAVFLSIRFGADLIKNGVIPLQPGLWIFVPAAVALAFVLYRLRR
ncbi:MAG: LptF/LptG family permease [Gammaproteobacteria bacterium]|nr:LptF/LptG family permease [Gammaproteobacteria bacterium]